MYDVNVQEIKKIDPDKSIIVVSDLHLGGMSGERTSKDFSLFLDWVKGLCNNENNVVFGEKKEPIHLKPPGLLILLGDILDFWVQREPLRKALMSDAFPVLSKLRDLPVSIVYVIGNHDREVYEVNGIITTEKGINIIIEPDQFPPAKNTRDRLNSPGLPIGKSEYIFLHGHQLDKDFQIAQSFSEYPGWVANNAAVFIAHPWFRRISWGIFFLFGFVYGILSGLGFLSFLPSLVHSGILVLFGMSVPLFLISIPSEYLRKLYIVVSENTVGKKILAFFQKYLHRERGKRINELIDIRKFRGMREKEGIKVVVFGHTHMPHDYNNLTLNKRFINSGSWDHEKPAGISDKEKLEYRIIGTEPDTVPGPGGKPTVPPPKDFVWNSFIYIDERKPRTFVWCADEGDHGTAYVLRIGGDSSGSVEHFVPE